MALMEITMSTTLTFRVRRSINNQYFWVLMSANNEKIAVSETYLVKESAMHSINLIRNWASSAMVVDETAYATTR